MSPIHFAAQYGNFPAFKRLVTGYGADPLCLTEVRMPPEMRRGEPRDLSEAEERGLTPYEIAEEAQMQVFLVQLDNFGRGKFCEKEPIQYDENSRSSWWRTSGSATCFAGR